MVCKNVNQEYGSHLPDEEVPGLVEGSHPVKENTVWKPQI